MRFELKLAARYFRARRKSLARFTSGVAVAGIAAGVASLIIAQSLANGFADEMRDKILADAPHVSVFAAEEGTPISDWRMAKAQIEKLQNVEKVSPTTYANALVIGSNEASYAILRVRESGNPDGNVESANQSDISLGARLAEKLNLKTGDAAEIVTLENRSAPQRTKARVASVFQTGLYEYDSTWIYISPENFARLSGEQEFAPTVLSVSLADVYKADETAAQIRDSLGANFKVVDWQQANQPLFAALSLERKFALAVISLIIFIAALNITATLALLANERRLDIAILRTCGARTSSLILIFLFEGLFLALCGISAGAAVGLLACFAGNQFKIVRISAEVYSLDSIPFHPNFANVALIIFIAFALCLIASAYPAFKASRVKPLENLRNQ